MGNSLSDTPLLFACLGGFAAGVLLTLLLGLFFRRGRRSRQQAELEEARQALQDYRAAVDRHFGDTADAVDELTRSYQKVFEQLSRSAAELMTPEAYRSQLEQRGSQAVVLSYRPEGAGSDDVAGQRLRLVPDDAPVPPQNDLDGADAAADAAPVFGVAAEPAAGALENAGSGGQANGNPQAENPADTA